MLAVLWHAGLRCLTGGHDVDLARWWFFRWAFCLALAFAVIGFPCGLYADIAFRGANVFEAICVTIGSCSRSPCITRWCLQCHWLVFQVVCGLMLTPFWCQTDIHWWCMTSMGLVLCPIWARLVFKRCGAILSCHIFIHVILLVIGFLLRYYFEVPVVMGSSLWFNPLLWRAAMAILMLCMTISGPLLAAKSDVTTALQKPTGEREWCIEVDAASNIGRPVCIEDHAALASIGDISVAEGQENNDRRVWNEMSLFEPVTPGTDITDVTLENSPSSADLAMTTRCQDMGGLAGDCEVSMPSPHPSVELPSAEGARDTALHGFRSLSGVQPETPNAEDGIPVPALLFDDEEYTRCLRDNDFSSLYAVQPEMPNAVDSVLVLAPPRNPEEYNSLVHEGWLQAERSTRNLCQDHVGQYHHSCPDTYQQHESRKEETQRVMEGYVLSAKGMKLFD